jgi:hypothetical protein
MVDHRAATGQGCNYSAHVEVVGQIILEIAVGSASENKQYLELLRH